MITITHSSYTGEFGLVHLVLYNSQQVTAPNADELFIAQFARELYHTKPSGRLVRWDGDKGLETVLESK